MAKRRKTINSTSKLVIEKCPLCGQKMDIYCTGNKNTPFVDGKTYPKLCFTCFHVPRTVRQKDGGIEEINLGYSPKYLYTAQELVDLGPADTLLMAQKSVAAVRASIKANPLKRNTKLTKPSDLTVELPWQY